MYAFDIAKVEQLAEKVVVSNLVNVEAVHALEAAQKEETEIQSRIDGIGAITDATDKTNAERDELPGLQDALADKKAEVQAYIDAKVGDMDLNAIHNQILAAANFIAVTKFNASVHELKTLLERVEKEAKRENEQQLEQLKAIAEATRKTSDAPAIVAPVAPVAPTTSTTRPSGTVQVNALQALLAARKQAAVAATASSAPKHSGH